MWVQKGFGFSKQTKFNFNYLQSVLSYQIIILGSGVITTRDFLPKPFLLEYSGELISLEEAEKREELYKSQMKECFMYFFQHENKTAWYVAHFYCLFFLDLIAQKLFQIYNQIDLRMLRQYLFLYVGYVFSLCTLMLLLPIRLSFSSRYSERIHFLSKMSIYYILVFQNLN